jgi:hypothetical protein
MRGADVAVNTSAAASAHVHGLGVNGAPAPPVGTAAGVPLDHRGRRRAARHQRTAEGHRARRLREEDLLELILSVLPDPELSAVPVSAIDAKLMGVAARASLRAAATSGPEAGGVAAAAAEFLSQTQSTTARNPATAADTATTTIAALAAAHAAHSPLTALGLTNTQRALLLQLRQVATTTNAAVVEYHETRLEKQRGHFVQQLLKQLAPQRRSMSSAGTGGAAAAGEGNATAAGGRGKKSSTASSGAGKPRPESPNASATTGKGGAAKGGKGAIDMSETAVGQAAIAADAAVAAAAATTKALDAVAATLRPPTAATADAAALQDEESATTVSPSAADAAINRKTREALAPTLEEVVRRLFFSLWGTEIDFFHGVTVPTKDNAVQFPTGIVSEYDSPNVDPATGRSLLPPGGTENGRGSSMAMSAVFNPLARVSELGVAIHLHDQPLRDRQRRRDVYDAAPVATAASTTTMGVPLDASSEARFRALLRRANVLQRRARQAPNAPLFGTLPSARSSTSVGGRQGSARGSVTSAALRSRTTGGGVAASTVNGGGFGAATRVGSLARRSSATVSMRMTQFTTADDAGAGVRGGAIVGVAPTHDSPCSAAAAVAAAVAGATGSSPAAKTTSASITSEQQPQHAGSVCRRHWSLIARDATLNFDEFIQALVVVATMRHENEEHYRAFLRTQHAARQVRQAKWRQVVVRELRAARRIERDLTRVATIRRQQLQVEADRLQQEGFTVTGAAGAAASQASPAAAANASAGGGSVASPITASGIASSPVTGGGAAATPMTPATPAITGGFSSPMGRRSSFGGASNDTIGAAAADASVGGSADAAGGGVTGGGAIAREVSGAVRGTLTWAAMPPEAARARPATPAAQLDAASLGMMGDGSAVAASTTSSAALFGSGGATPSANAELGVSQYSDIPRLAIAGAPSAPSGGAAAARGPSPSPMPQNAIAGAPGLRGRSATPSGKNGTTAATNAAASGAAAAGSGGDAARENSNRPPVTAQRFPPFPAKVEYRDARAGAVNDFLSRYVPRLVELLAFEPGIASHSVMAPQATRWQIEAVLAATAGADLAGPEAHHAAAMASAAAHEHKAGASTSHTRTAARLSQAQRFASSSSASAPAQGGSAAVFYPPIPESAAVLADAARADAAAHAAQQKASAAAHAAAAPAGHGRSATPPKANAAAIAQAQAEREQRDREAARVRTCTAFSFTAEALAHPMRGAAGLDVQLWQLQRLREELRSRTIYLAAAAAAHRRQQREGVIATRAAAAEAVRRQQQQQQQEALRQQQQQQLAAMAAQLQQAAHAAISSASQRPGSAQRNGGMFVRPMSAPQSPVLGSRGGAGAATTATAPFAPSIVTELQAATGGATVASQAAATAARHPNEPKWVKELPPVALGSPEPGIEESDAKRFLPSTLAWQRAMPGAYGVPEYSHVAAAPVAGTFPGEAALRAKMRAAAAAGAPPAPATRAGLNTRSGSGGPGTSRGGGGVGSAAEAAAAAARRRAAATSGNAAAAVQATAGVSVADEDAGVQQLLFPSGHAEFGHTTDSQRRAAEEFADAVVEAKKAAAVVAATRSLTSAAAAEAAAAKVEAAHAAAAVAAGARGSGGAGGKSPAKRSSSGGKGGAPDTAAIAAAAAAAALQAAVDAGATDFASGRPTGVAAAAALGLRVSRTVNDQGATARDPDANATAWARFASAGCATGAAGVAAAVRATPAFPHDAVAAREGAQRFVLTVATEAPPIVLRGEAPVGGYASAHHPVTPTPVATAQSQLQGAVTARSTAGRSSR